MSLIRYVFLLVVILIGGGWFVYGFVGSLTDIRLNYALRACDGLNDQLTIECTFEVIDEEVKRNKIAGGFAVFSAAYDRFPAFANGGCHMRAHRIGDVVYYNMFRGNPDVRSLEFPQETTACGYGFFHGFLEHYIQDFPTPEAVTDSCEYLIEHLEHRMRDIRPICYHGSGHGFMLAHTEKIDRKNWGDSRLFATEPSKNCYLLTKAGPGEVNQCLEGIYNVIVDYMDTKQYGFEFNDAKPFALCESVPDDHRHPCIYEAAQKLDRASGRSPEMMVELIGPLRNDAEKILAFEVGIAGVVMQVVANEGAAEKIYDQCSRLPETYLKKCIDSIVWGLYEHGGPQKEYKKTLEFCSLPALEENGFNEHCFQKVAERLERFYAKEKMLSICSEFPESFKDECLRYLEQKNPAPAEEKPQNKAPTKPQKV